jgi:hypothetical protein
VEEADEQCQVDQRLESEGSLEPGAYALAEQRGVERGITGPSSVLL